MLKIEVPWEEGTALRRWANFEDPASGEGEVIKRLILSVGANRAPRHPHPAAGFGKGVPLAEGRTLGDEGIAMGGRPAWGSGGIRGSDPRRRGGPRKPGEGLAGRESGSGARERPTTPGTPGQQAPRGASPGLVLTHPAALHGRVSRARRSAGGDSSSIFSFRHCCLQDRSPPERLYCAAPP